MMRKMTINIWQMMYFGLCWLSLSACVERFEFETEEEESFLVIEGLLTQGSGPHYMSVKNTTFFSQSPVNTPAVPVSSVSLQDDTGGKYFYTPIAPGEFVLDGQVEVEAFRTYSIEVVLNDGTTYLSFPEVMPPVLAPIAANAEVVVEEGIDEAGTVVEKLQVALTMDTNIRQEGRAFPLRWRLEESYFVIDEICGPFDSSEICYITQDLNSQDIILFDARPLRAETINDVPLAKVEPLPRYAYANRHYFHIYQYTLTQSAYEYWQDIQKIANQSGSIFNAPPAPVRGNIYNVDDPDELVLGYFEVSGVSTAVTFTENIDFAPFRFNSYCESGSVPSVEEACCFCTLLPNSSQTRPDFYL